MAKGYNNEIFIQLLFPNNRTHGLQDCLLYCRKKETELPFKQLNTFNTLWRKLRKLQNIFYEATILLKVEKKLMVDQNVIKKEKETGRKAVQQT